MIEYLVNENFWMWENTLAMNAQKSWFLPLVVALATQNFYQRTHRRILAFVAFTLVMEYITTDMEWTLLLDPLSNGPLYYIFGPFLLFFLWRIFVDYFYPEKRGYWRWWPVVVYAVLTVANALWGDGFRNFPSMTVGLYSFSGIIFCLGYFFALLRNPTVFHLERLPMFWVSAGFLIYFAGNFLLWVGLSFINYDKDFFDSIYRINGVVTIFLNLTLAIAIFLQPTHDVQDEVPKTVS
jgi:hypothetical protein